MPNTRSRPARNADPNNGRCLVTNLPDLVQSCHPVAQATHHETVRAYVSQITYSHHSDPYLTKLEYAWGLQYKNLNVDTRYNVMHCTYAGRVRSRRY